MVTNNNFEKNEKMTLPDVSLCAIVRDEKINPAGGIERFAESHVPFVEEAVIIDTGSLDGTREILEELQSKYKNLKVFDHKFNGFVESRNYSLSKVNTEYTLILDADELITNKKPKNEWEKIKYSLNSNIDCYRFEFENVSPSIREEFRSYWPDRLFKAKKTKFGFVGGDQQIWENHDLEAGNFINATIRHFITDFKSFIIKRENFYQNGIRSIFEDEIIHKDLAPSQIPGFAEWKEYNPKRDFYE